MRRAELNKRMTLIQDQLCNIADELEEEKDELEPGDPGIRKLAGTIDHLWEASDYLDSARIRFNR